MVTIPNGIVSAAFANEGGLKLLGLWDLRTARNGPHNVLRMAHNYLARPSMLFEFAVDDGPPQPSDEGLAITDFSSTRATDLSTGDRDR